MITIEKIKKIREATVDRIAHELLPHIDEFLIQETLPLHDGETRVFNLNSVIAHVFRKDDENQIAHDYSRMLKSRMEVANRLAEMYKKYGWTVEVIDRCKEEYMVEAAMLFSIEEKESEGE